MTSLPIKNLPITSLTVKRLTKHDCRITRLSEYLSSTPYNPGHDPARCTWTTY